MYNIYTILGNNFIRKRENGEKTCIDCGEKTMKEVERKKYVPWEIGITNCREEDVIRTSTVDDGDDT